MAHRDSRGTELKIGDHVAYNRSGDVVLGVITHLTTIISIETDEEFVIHGYRSPSAPKGPNGRPLSKVKNGSSCLIMDWKPTAEDIYEYLKEIQ